MKEKASINQGDVCHLSSFATVPLHMQRKKKPFFSFSGSSHVWFLDNDCRSPDISAGPAIQSTSAALDSGS